MRHLDAAATRRALPFDRLIDALRVAFVEGGEVPPRQVLEIATPGSPPMTSLVMPAWQPGRCYGVKVINIAPGNAARGLPGLHASYLLHDATTGVPLALIDGNEITARRTAAASALAAANLARDDAFAGARLFFDTEEALKKSGELLGPMARGVFAPPDLQGTLAALVRGEAADRRDATERTVFKSVGTALEDLAAAMLACAAGASPA